MAVMFRWKGGEPELAVIKKDTVPGGAVRRIGYRKNQPVEFGTTYITGDGERRKVVELLGWEEVPE